MTLRLQLCLLPVLAVAAGLPAAAQARTLSLVTLGDSVPRGTNCHCSPYPQLLADDLSRAAGLTVHSQNDSVGGYTTSSVLRQLTSNQSAIADVRGADAVAVEIGANDVPYSSSCGARLHCYVGRVPAMRLRLARIVARIHRLAPGRHVDVVLLDYWSIWLGGAYAKEKGRAYTATATEMTRRVNDAIRAVAAQSGSGYVDVRAAFKGPSYRYDETHYLSNDGDHPNAAGHARIATAAEASIRKALGIAGR